MKKGPHRLFMGSCIMCTKTIHPDLNPKLVMLTIVMNSAVLNWHSKCYIRLLTVAFEPLEVGSIAVSDLGIFSGHRDVGLLGCCCGFVDKFVQKAQTRTTECVCEGKKAHLKAESLKTFNLDSPNASGIHFFLCCVNASCLNSIISPTLSSHNYMLET